MDGRLDGWLLLLVCVLCCRAFPAASGERIRYGKDRQVCTIANAELKESSGVACSRLNPNVFWSHNDSGDRPRLFAFNRKGEDLGVFVVNGGRLRDWEDMASFKRGQRSFLAVGDVGDNEAKRKECTVYVIGEPSVAVAKGRKEGRPAASIVQTIRFKYEDGPHNCESLAVDPTDGSVYLVSKVGGKQCKVYSFVLPAQRNPKPLVAKAVATLKIPTTSAMDISPDGLRAVVLTYGNAYEYVRGPKESWAQGFSQEPRMIGMPRRKQGESICYGHDGKTLYLTSEKLPTPLLEVPVAK